MMFSQVVEIDRAGRKIDRVHAKIDRTRRQIDQARNESNTSLLKSPSTLCTIKIGIAEPHFASAKILVCAV